MGRTLPIIRGIAIANSGLTLMARLRGSNGRLITQATLSAIAYTVYDLTAAEEIDTGSLTISATVYDALQQADPRWTVDSADELGPDREHGYNFLATVDGDSFAENAHRYRVDVKFTPTSGAAWFVPFEATTVAVYGS